MIALGDAGDYVRVWQRIVGAKPDGKFGPATAEKVKIWQAARGVEPDAVIGPLTRAALSPGDLIKPYEGLRLAPYDDHDGKTLRWTGESWRRPDGSLCLGYPTIGWGRRLFPGQVVLACSREEADRWFDEDLAKTRLPAVRRVGITDPGQITACASFAYNCGTGALTKLSKDWSKWTEYSRTKGVVNAGLLKRREEEFSLFRGIDGVG